MSCQASYPHSIGADDEKEQEKQVELEVETAQVDFWILDGEFDPVTGSGWPRRQQMRMLRALVGIGLPGCSYPRIGRHLRGRDVDVSWAVVWLSWPHLAGIVCRRK